MTFFVRRSIFLAAVAAVAVALPALAQVGHPLRQPVRGVHGAVAAGSDWATDAGMRIYYKGGNAVDAGVATMFAALGDRAFALRHGRRSAHPDPHQGRQGLFDRGRRHHAEAGHGRFVPQPAGCSPFEITFRRAIRADLKGIIPDAGLMPALVPGMVDAALVALREFGTKSSSEVIAPAIELADGYAVDDMRARSLRLQPCRSSSCGRLPKRTSCRTAARLRIGEIFRQPDLARTLRAMAEAEKKALAAGASRAGGHRRGARLFLSRRNRPQDRRVQQSQRRPAAL